MESRTRRFGGAGKRRPLLFFAAAVAVAMVASGSFFAVRALNGNGLSGLADPIRRGQVEAVPPPTPFVPANLTPPATPPEPANSPPARPCVESDYPAGSPGAILCADGQKPLFSGTLAGIRLAGAATSEQGDLVKCSHNLDLPRPDFSKTAGTPFDIFTSGLPEGMSNNSDIDKPQAYACDGELVGSDRLVSLAGSTIHIIRALRPEPWASSSAPAERITEGRVKGKPAVFVHPVIANSDMRVIFADPYRDGWVVTELIGSGLPLSQLINVAEELTR